MLRLFDSSITPDTSHGSLWRPTLTLVSQSFRSNLCGPEPLSPLHPKTPERNGNTTRPVPGITPQSRGSSVRQRQEGDTDRVDNYNRDDYEEYIREHLKNRVFVDFEVFIVEQMRGQRQTGRNDLPGKGERVASGW